MASGPLKGVKVLEFAGIGPGPFCAMLLSDMGAEVVRIERKSGRDARIASRGRFDITQRGRRSIAMDLKNPDAIATCLKMMEKADILLEGFRPGVMERLGLGPDVCLGRNKKLVYGRMTGWGQEGPMAHAAGHDINYIALTGLLHAVGEPDGRPLPPLNVTGDYGGGALYLALGVCAALFEASRSGEGQVVDSAMTDGSASLMATFYGLLAGGMWQDKRGVNMLDGGAHFYGAYETADGKYVSLGAIEAKFYALLREKAGMTDPAFDAQMNSTRWPELQNKVAAIIKTKTRDEWVKILEGTDACFAPVLTMSEAAEHPHNKARKTLVEVDGVMQPNVAPRFSRTPSKIQGAPVMPGEHTHEVLEGFGFSADEIGALESSGAI